MEEWESDQCIQHLNAFPIKSEPSDERKIERMEGWKIERKKERNRQSRIDKQILKMK